MAECQELRGAIPRTNLEEVTKVTLWKTTIVIWSDRDPSGYELVDLARDATDGNSKCSKCATKVVDKPEADPDFSGVRILWYRRDRGTAGRASRAATT